MIRANWPVTDRISVGRNWTSGYYLAVARITAGEYRDFGVQIPFIIRAPPSERSALIVIASVNTWQAYNNWPGRARRGKSLYDYNSRGGAATHVSFDRPFGYDTNSSPLAWEYQLVRFLERRGYDASYTTEVDVDRAPGELMSHRLIVTAGHSEYWSKKERDGLETARNRGRNLAFMGGNTGVWQIRYENSHRTIVEYRDAAKDPDARPRFKTAPFSMLTPPRPPCTLTGVTYHGLSASKQHDYHVQREALSHPWFDGTGFRSSAAPVRAVVGYEWDGIDSECGVPNLTNFFHWGDDVVGADAVSYTAVSGARIFSSGTMEWSWALDDFRPRFYSRPPAKSDPRIQKLTERMLDALSGRR